MGTNPNKAIQQILNYFENINVSTYIDTAKVIKKKLDQYQILERNLDLQLIVAIKNIPQQQIVIFLNELAETFFIQVKCQDTDLWREFLEVISSFIKSVQQDMNREHQWWVTEHYKWRRDALLEKYPVKLPYLKSQNAIVNHAALLKKCVLQYDQKLEKESSKQIKQEAATTPVQDRGVTMNMILQLKKRIMIIKYKKKNSLLKAQVDINNKVNWIDQHQLGKTLLDTIYLQLKAQEPIERLLGTLDQLEERYYQEQKEDDQQHRDFQDSCTAVLFKILLQDLTALSKDLKESQEESLRLEAKLEGELYPRKQITSQVLQQKQIELKGLNKELNELDDQRTQEQQEFELKVAEHQEVIEIISEAKTIFSENLQTQNGEPAFIQRTNKLSQDAQISKLGVELLQKHFSQSMKRASIINYNFFQKKLNLFTENLGANYLKLWPQLQPDHKYQQIQIQLLDKVQDSLSLERFAEDKRVQAFNKARNLLTISINVTTTSIANALSELALQYIYQQNQEQMNKLIRLLQVLIMQIKGLIMFNLNIMIDIISVRKKLVIIKKNDNKGKIYKKKLIFLEMKIDQLCQKQLVQQINNQETISWRKIRMISNFIHHQNSEYLLYAHGAGVSNVFLKTSYLSALPNVYETVDLSPPLGQQPSLVIPNDSRLYLPGSGTFVAKHQNFDQYLFMF
ncbi:hypothetical protein pb186bvf_013811 [Paramecium bursaria]